MVSGRYPLNTEFRSPSRLRFSFPVVQSVSFRSAYQQHISFKPSFKTRLVSGTAIANRHNAVWKKASGGNGGLCRRATPHGRNSHSSIRQQSALARCAETAAYHEAIGPRKRQSGHPERPWRQSRKRYVGRHHGQPARTARRPPTPDAPEEERRPGCVGRVSPCWLHPGQGQGPRDCRWLDPTVIRPCLGASAYASLDRAAAPLADSAVLKHRRSASCTTSSRQSDGRLPYRSPPSNGPSLLRSGPRPTLDGRANHESLQRGTSPILPAMPEGVWEHDSPPRTLKSTFRLPPSYESDDDARTLHTPVMAGNKSRPLGPCSPLYFPDTAAVLVPRIVVTPEHGTVDEGTVTVWVAVQLSAEVCRALASEHGHCTATDHRPSPG
jgi:hypothetical protein